MFEFLIIVVGFFAGITASVAGFGIGTGALVHTVSASNLLQIIFAIMLVLAGVIGVLRVSEHLRFGKTSAAVTVLLQDFSAD